MASFKILSVTVNPSNVETYDTLVQYTFDNSQTLTTLVSHFRPKTVNEIGDSIAARGVTEWKRIQDIATAQATAQALSVFIGSVFPFSQV